MRVFRGDVCASRPSPNVDNRACTFIPCSKMLWYLLFPCSSQALYFYSYIIQIHRYYYKISEPVHILAKRIITCQLNFFRKVLKKHIPDFLDSTILFILGIVKQKKCREPNKIAEVCIFLACSCWVLMELHKFVFIVDSIVTHREAILKKVYVCQ